MEKVEEIKKIAQCQNCHKNYDNGLEKYVHIRCKHHTCESCLKNYYHNITGEYRCRVCNGKSLITVVMFSHDASTVLLSMYESSVAKCSQIENELKNEIAILKEKQSALEKTQDDFQKCSECQKTDSEQDMQLCTTCHELKFKGLEDVKKNALCPACAIRKHMRKGHQTVDFFPYLSAYNFSSHSPKITSKLEELKNAQVLLNNTFSDFNALSINVSESYNVLSDMARRSKSTKNQLEFIEKMEGFTNESKSIHVGADSELKERTKLLQESLTKIKDGYNARMDNCVDESEIIKLEAKVDPKNHQYGMQFIFK